MGGLGRQPFFSALLVQSRLDLTQPWLAILFIDKSLMVNSWIEKKTLAKVKCLYCDKFSPADQVTFP